MKKYVIERARILLSLLFVLCVGAAFCLIRPAAAEEKSGINLGALRFAEGDFAMAEGASVRVVGDGKNGLRFIAGFKDGFDMTGVTAFGMLIGPQDLIEESLDMDDVDAGNAVNIAYTAKEEAATYLFDAQSAEGEAYKVFGGSLSNIYIGNYDRVFTGLAYYVKGGETFYAASGDSNDRSAEFVAKAALDDPAFESNTDEVKSIVHSYANKYQVQNGSFLYGMSGWTSMSNQEGEELGFVVGKVNSDKEEVYNYMCADYGTIREKLFSFVNTDDNTQNYNNEFVTGTLTSSPFVVKDGAWLTFSWGGGGNGDVLLKICKEDDTIVATYDNIYNNVSSLKAKTLKRAVDLGGLNLAGETVYLVFEDNSTSNYGGIVVSDIVTNATECPADAMEIAEHGSYILNAGFEDGNLNGWKATEGEAFNAEYVANSDETFWDVQREFNAIGSKFFRGERNESATGKMRSASFVLGGDGYISFLFGGAGNKEVYVQFVDAGTDKVLQKVTNDAFHDPNFSNNMNRVFVDLHNHVGKTIYIEIVDNAEGGFGFANLDDFCVSLTSHEVTRLLNETKAWASGLPTDTENASQNAANEHIKNYYATYVLPFELI